MSAPKAAIDDTSAATDELVAGLKDLDIIFDRLDGLAEGKKNSNPDFYNTYKSASIIVDSKGGSGRPKTS